MTELKNYICQFETAHPSNCTKIYFARKTRSDSIKYVTHQPMTSNDIQYNIIETVFPYIKKQIDTQQVVEYNPLGVLDSEIEVLLISKIPMFSEFLSSISQENVNHEMNSLIIDKIDFYCVEIAYNGKTLYLFRQFQKLKKLRKGFLTQIINNELNAIENNFLGIDELIDIIVFEDKLFLFNHISLERIFDYRDEFLKKTNEALGQILTKNVINNIEQFADDCRSDVRVMKRFTNIMTKERLPLFFDNYDKVPEIVSELELDIEFDKDGKLIYRERSQLFHIINLLSDAYFKSLLAQRTGIVKIEGDI